MRISELCTVSMLSCLVGKSVAAATCTCDPAEVHVQVQSLNILHVSLPVLSCDRQSIATFFVADTN